MKPGPDPVFRTREKVLLIGTMAVYDSQAEGSERIPDQWRSFRATHPILDSSARLYGASPCTGDGKLHYFTGVALDGHEHSIDGEQLILEGGEYAVCRVENAHQLRDNWIWALNEWLPTSGRREKNAPEFERFTDISAAGLPIGPVEIWIPLEPLENS